MGGFPKMLTAKTGKLVSSRCKHTNPEFSGYESRKFRILTVDWHTPCGKRARAGGRPDGLSKIFNLYSAASVRSKKTPADNLIYANAAHSGVFSDPEDYPSPPVGKPTFKTAIDTLSAKITAALDGAKRPSPNAISKDRSLST